ncbi:MAG: substrate-binding domain-containing protein [Deltaproteobacteria bacterium]|nr:substrate-binding domain-containing protein [Deltaproteobacteria bacterium]
MKRACILLTVLLLSASLPAAAGEIKMSTTTSTQASGLLDVLLPAFTRDTGIQVKVFAKGTGAAIRDGMDGNVDVVFVHAKQREERFVEQGFGTRRYAVMHNDFVILGPSSDPAGIKGMKEAAALEKIAAAKAPFVSRGDDSGTHTKEQELWAGTSLDLERKKGSIAKKGVLMELDYLAPGGDWYLSVGQGMGRALTIAEQKQAYVLSDRGTFLKYKYGREQGLDLDVLVEGDPALFNPYGVIPVNPEKYPHVNYADARAFAQWVTSKQGQKLIADYRVEGRSLFVPDAMDMD